MKVNIVARHLEIPAETQDYAREKMSKLDHFFAGIQHVDVVCDVNGNAQHVEATVVLGHGTRLLAKAEADDLGTAIDLAETKLQKQIRRFHARLKAHRDRRRISDAGAPDEAPPEEETYEQVVREMLEEDDD